VSQSTMATKWGIGWLLVTLIAPAPGCTIIAVGRKATVDGTAFVAHTDDAGGDASDVRLVRVPAMDHERGAQRPVYAFEPGYPRLVSAHRGPQYAPKEGQTPFKPLGFIPQVAHTFGYFDANYGLTNEVGLSLAESTASAKTVGWPRSLPYGKCLFDISELSKVALERCATARCAIATMGDLAVAHGFYSNFNGEPEDPSYEDSAEILAVGDRTGEVWIFHVMTGPHGASAVWAAQRIPEDTVLAAPNTFIIRTIDFSDTHNFMYSQNMRGFAADMGWWNASRGPFDFTDVFTDPKPVPVVPLYDGRRMWRIYDLVAPSLQLDSRLGYLIRPGRPVYPFSVRPDRKLRLRDVTHILRDHYEGTPYDLTKGLAAGPFGNPVRWDGDQGFSGPDGAVGAWERPVSIFRCVYSFVMQIRPEQPAHLATVMWFGLDAPHGTAYVPFYSSQTTVPAPYLEGKQSEFSLRSAYWAFNLLNGWSLTMYSVIHKDVAAAQREVEAEGVDFVQRTDAAVAKLGAGAAVRHIEKHQTAYAERVVTRWWALVWRLVAKYNNGFITTGERKGDMAIVGYPIWWLKAMKYDKWPGNTFLYPPGTEPVRPVERPSAPQPPAAAPVAITRAGVTHLLCAALGVVGTLIITRPIQLRSQYQRLS